MEEECRVGAALKNYFLKTKENSSLYVMGAAEGTLARTLGTVCKGRLKTLSCSPTAANKDNFFKFGEPKNSYFILSPYHKITDRDIKPFFPNFDGFDVIIEDTTFQMYSSNREKQLKFISQKLKSDGIIGFLEKFKNDDALEFSNREVIKDTLFKTKFFSEKDIQSKKEEVLSDMNNGLVTLQQFQQVLSKFFSYALINWNSGNFYTIYASNSKNNLLSFLSYMTPSLTPKPFAAEKTPTILFGLNKNEIKYRKAK